MKIKNLQIAIIALATLNIQFLTYNAQAQIGFDPPIYFPGGPYPSSLTRADFNGDTKLDLAIARIQGSVLILLGDGVGHFVADSFAVGAGSQSIISADFNGDGKADLATANYTTHNVSVLLGNGSGGFGTATDITLGDYPVSITSSDFNGDGKPDLAVAKFGSNSVSILLGNGSGGFAATASIAAGGNPHSIITADFNGDGKADLALADTTLIILLGNGLGNFALATCLSVGFAPQSVVSADFNEDGKVDLAVPNYFDSKISVLIGNGTGGFGTVKNFITGMSPYFIVSADFNGDGKADLAVTNYGCNTAVSILQGDGTGGFDGLTHINAGTIDNTSDIISADINGDGKMDLAFTNYYSKEVVVLLNNAFASIPTTPPICLVTVDSTLTHNVVVWEKTNLNMTALDSIVVYREISTNNYRRIGVVLCDSISSFDDFSANPASTSYRYRLRSKSSHGKESLLYSYYHNTMYLTHAGADFSWTPYKIENNITPVSNYNVYRDNNSTGNFQIIGNTTGNQFGYTDINYSSYPSASYYVEAVMTTGSCNPTRALYSGSRSNVKLSAINSYLSAISIYPNPATNTINITGITGKTTLRLYDAVGLLIFENVVENNNSINTNLLAEGIYTLLISDSTGETFNKVVVSH